MFTLGFSWLFPRGCGDLCDCHNISLTLEEWADILLRYEDCCFARDVMWSFYTSNFLVRRKNQTSGAFL